MRKIVKQALAEKVNPTPTVAPPLKHKLFRDALLINWAQHDPAEGRRQVLRAHSQTRKPEERADLVSALIVFKDGK